MKRSIVLLTVLALAMSALAPATAAKKKKKKKAKPVETTLFMHGEQQFGELDGAQWAADGFGGFSPLTLTPEEPGGGQPKSMNYFSPLLNDQCTGLPLAFPTFNGDLKGTIKGDATMSLEFLSAPATVTARIWADVPPFSACNDDYIDPASEVQFDVPPGRSTVEVVFEGLNLKAGSFILVEILVNSGPDYRGQVGRLLYDSSDAPSSITFGCIPASGKSCTP